MSKARILSLISIGAALLAFSSVSPTTKPTGPFDLKLELSHMPQLNEEVALVCSVTSRTDVDSGMFQFAFTDTSMVKVIDGEEIVYRRFEKGKTEEFRLTISFLTEGIVSLYACADQFFDPICGQGNNVHLDVKTYKDKAAVLLERRPWKIPDTLPFDPRRPDLRDSLKARAESLIIKQR